MTKLNSLYVSKLIVLFFHYNYFALILFVNIIKHDILKTIMQKKNLKSFQDFL